MFQIISKQKKQKSTQNCQYKKKKKEKKKEKKEPELTILLTSQTLESFLCGKKKMGHGNEVSLFINTVHDLKDPRFSKGLSFCLVWNLLTAVADVETSVKEN